ncbi:MAG: lysostaphin resistance A-like protein [Candidatus Bathyarchaeia archaeon]
MLIVSYFIVLLLSILFSKIEAKKPLSEVFKVHSYGVISIGMVFAFVFQGVWFTVSLTIGGDLNFTAFPSLRGYESYAVYSFPLAFLLYVVFAVFGAFVEEVTFRGYVQSRIASRQGHVIGISVASLFFSLQHIRIFNWSWMVEFLQTQFIYVFCFGIFVGYLFVKSEQDIWSVFTFHAVMNIINISLPIKATYRLPFSTQIVAIVSFVFLMLLLRLVSIEELIHGP